LEPIQDVSKKHKEEVEEESLIEQESGKKDGSLVQGTVY
jgi:hypothetical protein